MSANELSETNKGLVAERFAANLASCKQETGLSLTEIAERAEIHRTHLGLLLRGKRLVRVDTVVKLAAALEVPPSVLLAGVRWRPAQDENSSGRFELIN
jgi:transcriptional regulator with XRE-family HTH domain